jgi:hypothetical protein
VPALKRAREAEREEYVRWLMDFALGVIAPAEAESEPIVEALVAEAVLGLSGNEPANAAQAALRRLGPEGRKTLAAMLAAPPPAERDDGDDGAGGKDGEGDDEETGDDRNLYALALAVVGPPARSELPALEKALDDPVPQVRVAAALAVWSLDGPAEKPIAVLIDLVENGEGEVRRGAATTLGVFGPQAKQAVPVLLKAAEDDSFAPAPATGLAMISSRAVELVPKLVEIIRRRGEHAHEAAIALLLLGRPVAPVLGGLLSSESSSDRRVAMNLLRELGPDAAPAVPALADALESPVGNLRDDAAELLGVIGPEAAPAIPAVIDYCKRKGREAPPGAYGVRRGGDVLWKLGPAGKAAVAEWLRPHRQAILDGLTPPVGDKAAGAAA